MSADMKAMFLRTVTASSVLPASTSSVWRQVGSMQGVNEELYPWLSMSYPRTNDEYRFDTCEVGSPLFTATIRLFCFIPYDRHRLRFTRLVPGEGFREESTSWTMRQWIHVRTLAGTSGGTQITDQVSFEPRIRVIGWLAGILVTAAFRHRHSRLRKRFRAVHRGWS